jgi:aspartyl protease family protein
MVAGKAGGSRAAQFYFRRSLRWLLWRARALFAGVVIAAWRVLEVWILRPLAFRLWWLLRWFASERARLAAALSVILFFALALVALAAASPAAAQSVTLRSQHENIFQADVLLNNHAHARAFIDTGATYLSMCSALATRLNLTLGERVLLRTSNGTITARRTMVRSVRIGPLEVRDVDAVVKAERALCNEELLVGMTVLHKLHVTLDGRTLTLASGRGEDKPVRWSERALLAAIMSALLISLLGIRKPRRRLVLRFNGGSRLGKKSTFSGR